MGYMTSSLQPIDYGRAQPPRRHSAGLLLFLSVGMGCLFALTLLFVFILTLHIADSSYSLSMVLDGQMLAISLVIGFAAGVVVFLPFYFVARSKSLWRCLAVLVACVVGELAIATPLNWRIACAGSFVAFAIGLVIVWLVVPALPPAYNT